jgi:putative NIF3 family GTP cyclohydrolase 1 type 2
LELSLATLVADLNQFFAVARFPRDQNGIYRPSPRPVSRIGLALEPWSGIGTWVREECLDALFLHRPWRLDERELPPDIGVLAYHLAFDLTLTLCLNPLLADTLHMTAVVPFAFKDSLPLGMLGDIRSTPLETFVALLTKTFATPPEITETHTETVSRLAVVGAMNDALIREAAAQGVQLYITGQFRQPARRAVQETRMTVALIGHTTSELWGLRALADLLRQRGLIVLIAPTIP